MSTTTDVQASVRKFLAPTSREALRLARESLGPDALVLASRALADGVEIVAMAEDAAGTAVAHAEPAPPAVPAAPAAPEPVAAAHADSVLREIHSMRGMIEEQLASVVWSDQQRRDPVRGHLLRTLLGAGFSPQLSKSMLEQLPTGQSQAQGMAFVRSELIRTLPVCEDEEALLAQGGVYALVGPTGVGKTTTTAKLAARWVMRFGAAGLALVTTDSYRIGAYEQLRIYGRILDVPVHAVKDANDLQLVLQDLRDKHLVLIDTVGMSQRDRAVSEQIAMLGASQRAVRRLLVLNASSHGDTLNEVVHAYRQGGGELAGCIFTKVDEATHPGALLDIVIRHRLPVHYVSNGQKVPENLLPADRTRIVDSVFQNSGRSALFVPGEIDLELPAAAAQAGDAAVQARAEAERMRLQYQRLIQVMAHDAEELATAARALAAAPLGFEMARSLWRQAGDEGMGQKTVLQALHDHAHEQVSASCSRYVLALSGQTSLGAGEHAAAYELQGSLLLSDRDGQPLAAPNQWLALGASRPAPEARRPGLRQLQWLGEQDFGKPLVHLLNKLPAPAVLCDWQTQGQRWLVRVPGASTVLDPDSGAPAVLSQLSWNFDAARAVQYRGKAALQSEAQAQVQLRVADAGQALPCRAMVMRIADADSGKVLAQWQVLTNLGAEVPAAQLAQWQTWAIEQEPCFRLMRACLPSLGGVGEPGDPELMKRLLMAGQIGTTVWRLQQAQGAWAERARALLGQLTGRVARPDRALPAHVLCEGLGKLFVLLDALGTESPAPVAGQPVQQS